VPDDELWLGGPGQLGAAGNIGSGPESDSPYPDSIVVLGHSGATGANSDDRGVDVKANSWATGTNPTVNSIYLRVLDLNPAIEDHNTNLAQDGSKVDDLLHQAGSALELDPLPELFLIQSVDNDVHCALDTDSLAAYGATLTSVLEMIATGAPEATIFIVSSPPGTTQNYADVIKEVPAAWRSLAGDEPCDMFDESGVMLPDNVATQEVEFQAYLGKITEVCAQFPSCKYDGGAAYNMVIELADLSSDYAHLSVAGHQKFASAIWEALY
jgi:lysophospholipase L1-like esterase